jgi:hypothetical protein
MRLIPILWRDTPHWARGLFLGNLGYVALTILYFLQLGPRQYWSLAPGMPFLLLLLDTPMQPRVLLSHVVWCALGTILVPRFGEVKGLLVTAGLIFAANIAYVAYGIMQFSLTH